MTRTATVNYHVHKPERQSFVLDAHGIIGNLISPELAETEIAVQDVRSSNVQATFQDDSVGFSKSPTQVTSFESTDSWQATYNHELTTLLKEQIDAKEVVIFDHTVRIDDPDAVRKPARNVHSDYSEQGAKQRLIDILGVDKAKDWSKAHYAFINVWRPIDAPINSAPLGFVLPKTVSEEDWVLLDLIYPDRKGQILGLVGNPNHTWVYMSKMTPDDIAFFNIFDNRGRPSIAHSALELIEDPNIQSTRKSIESRTVVRF